MSKFEPKSLKGSVPNGQSLFAVHDAIRWFKCKLKSPNNTGTDTNLMPIHHFRTIFPYLCDSSGQPKEGVLEKAESSFESYSGDSVTVIGQTKIYAKNKQTQQFPNNQDIRDCQRERSHPSRQCCMPMAWTDCHAL